MSNGKDTGTSTGTSGLGTTITVTKPGTHLHVPQILAALIGGFAGGLIGAYYGVTAAMNHLAQR